MYRTIAAVMVAASLAGAAGAQTTTPPGIPAATTSSQSADAFSLENALAAGGMPSIPSAVLDNGAASGGERIGSTSVDRGGHGRRRCRDRGAACRRLAPQPRSAGAG